ncbi:MAG: hypothetical protein IPL71_12625 [Anaerolineales bacterium]|uniref:hypothetical protein n=1 Tax=Candidatus Villigracilis proximus TaxID=3140683 RepID=UPI0031360FF8|nr:hypothetical protein [Anaerolineales bacterium]
MNRNLNIQLLPFLKSASLKRGAIFGGILISALLAFELFNFGTTSFALQDVLGDLKFAGIRWSAILAFAFCGIDFAGIARIFTPEQGRDEPAEVWYLFGAWLLAAAFNAMLTWWGVSVAILNHNAEGGSLVGQAVMIKVVPIFVAAMVWLIRVLIIGTFSVAGERLFTLADAGQRPVSYQNQSQRPAASNQPLTSNLPATNYPRPAPKPRPAPVPSYGTTRSEPTYHPVGMTAMGRNEQNSSSTRR